MSIVIIGSGLAGYHFIRAFRQHDSETAIHVITQDAGDFYPKPQLSTAIASNKQPNDLITQSAEKMANTYQLTIDCHTTVTAIDTAKQTISCDQTEIHYDSLIIATGADTPMPRFEGNGTEHVMQINDLYQYTEFRKAIEGKHEIAVLGAGLVGTEFANDLTKGGYHTHVIDPAPTPLSQLIPEAVGLRLQECFTGHGVEWHLGQLAKRIDYDGTKFTLTLSNNQQIEVDQVLSAIGLKPRITLAKEAGIKTELGIVVNHQLETSAKNVYAIGDCMELEGFGFLPYIAPLLQCAKALALSLSGRPTTVNYPAMPVSVKTSLYPLCICLPLTCTDGKWAIEDNDGTIRAMYHDADNNLRGFILSKTALKERMALNKSLPDWV
jgi:rubredoxin-NAD+ reductase